MSAPDDPPPTPPPPHHYPAIDCVSSGVRFVSSRPPAIAGEPSLAVVIRALANCKHPEESATPAILLEPDGSRMTIYWCGCCGAVRVPGVDEPVWNTPGLVMALNEDSRWDALSRMLKSLASTATDLRNIAHIFRTAIGDTTAEPSLEDVLAGVTTLDEACVDVERITASVASELLI